MVPTFEHDGRQDGRQTHVCGKTPILTAEGGLAVQSEVQLGRSARTGNRVVAEAQQGVVVEGVPDHAEHKLCAEDNPRGQLTFQQF